MRHFPLITLLISIAFSSTVLAEDKMHEHKKTQNQTSNVINNSEVKPNEVLMTVHGIVCSFCTQGVKKKLAKFSFIDRDRLNEGIMMDIENQKITVAIKADESADIPAMFKAILSSGYEPIEAKVLGEDGKVKTLKADS